jgi:hypothetical protein
VACANFGSGLTLVQELFVSGSGVPALRRRLLTATPLQDDLVAALCTIMKNCADASLRVERIVDDSTTSQLALPGD